MPVMVDKVVMQIHKMAPNMIQQLPAQVVMVEVVESQAMAAKLMV